MNWTWSVRSGDGGMNGLEFTRATTAGGFSRALVHAAPAHAHIEIRGDDDQLIVRADLKRTGDYSPMTLLEIDGGRLRRRPDESLYGLPVLVTGGEVGLLQHWEHAPDHSWWRWSVEFSNHVGRPADWTPRRGRAPLNVSGNRPTRNRSTTVAVGAATRRCANAAGRRLQDRRVRFWAAVRLRAPLGPPGTRGAGATRTDHLPPG